MSALLSKTSTARSETKRGTDATKARAGLGSTARANPLKTKATSRKAVSHMTPLRVRAGVDLVVTNYKYWMHANRFRPELGRFDCLVLDEAHHAPTELADFLSTELGAADMQLLGSGGPRSQDNAGAWADWAKSHEKALSVAARRKTAVACGVAQASSRIPSGKQAEFARRHG
jgi:Rad3-related DNA helicase